MCVRVANILSFPLAKSALPPSDSKNPCMSKFCPGGFDEYKVTVGVHVCTIYLCQHVFFTSIIWRCVWALHSLFLRMANLKVLSRAASEQCQGLWHKLSQYGNCSSSSAAQRLPTLTSLSWLPKIPIRSTTPAPNQLKKTFSIISQTLTNKCTFFYVACRKKNLINVSESFTLYLSVFMLVPLSLE